MKNSKKLMLLEKEKNSLQHWIMLKNGRKNIKAHLKFKILRYLKTSIGETFKDLISLESIGIKGLVEAVIQYLSLKSQNKD
jgi:hypothetical protein